MQHEKTTDRHPCPDWDEVVSRSAQALGSNQVLFLEP
jgi:hypothetical protein